MSHRTFHLIGAKGGSGTTSLAVMLASHANADYVVGDPDELRTVAGSPTAELNEHLTATETHPGPEPGLTVVVDGGTIAHPRPQSNAPGITLGILRGPCFIGTRNLANAEQKPDGLILVTEPGRALSPADVAKATEIPVVATIAIETAIARTIDAGLLFSRPPRNIADQLTRIASLPGEPSGLNRQHHNQKGQQHGTPTPPS